VLVTYKFTKSIESDHTENLFIYGNLLLVLREENLFNLFYLQFIMTSNKEEEEGERLEVLKISRLIHIQQELFLLGISTKVYLMES